MSSSLAPAVTAALASLGERQFVITGRLASLGVDWIARLNEKGSYSRNLLLGAVRALVEANDARNTDARALERRDGLLDEAQPHADRLATSTVSQSVIQPIAILDATAVPTMIPCSCSSTPTMHTHLKLLRPRLFTQHLHLLLGGVRLQQRVVNQLRHFPGTQLDVLAERLGRGVESAGGRQRGEDGAAERVPCGRVGGGRDGGGHCGGLARGFCELQSVDGVGFPGRSAGYEEKEWQVRMQVACG